MKERTIPCIYYVCANQDCQKGRKDVTLAETCQHCQKYRPRKSGNPVKETLVSKKRKNQDREFKKQLSEF